MSECAHYEPTIDEIMADPTIHALMRADRVNVERLRLKLLQHSAANGRANASGTTRAWSTGASGRSHGTSAPHRQAAWG